LLYAVLALSCLAGCKGLFAGQGLPEDPLLLDKFPLRARAIAAPPITLAYSEPVPPGNPFAASASILAERPQNSGPTPATLTNRPRSEVPDKVPD
jgi:hypothetical protein